MLIYSLISAFLVYLIDISWSSVNCSRYGHRYVHGVVQSEMYETVLEEVHDLVSVLGGCGDYIIVPPSGGLGGDFPLIFSFLCISLERFVAIRVNVGRICGELGRGSNCHHYIGDGCCNLCGHVREDAPEDIGIDGQSRCWVCHVFVAIVFYLHALVAVACFIAWSFNWMGMIN